MGEGQGASKQKGGVQRGWGSSMWEHVVEGSRALRTQLGRIAGAGHGDPELGVWTLSSLMATARVSAQAGLAPLPGPLRCRPPQFPVASLLFDWAVVPQPCVQEAAGGRPLGQAVGVSIPCLSPPLASQGSPKPGLRPRPALSFRGAALHRLFPDVPTSRPLRPRDQIVRGSVSFKLLILFSCMLLMPRFKFFLSDNDLIFLVVPHRAPLERESWIPTGLSGIGSTPPFRAALAEILILSCFPPVTGGSLRTTPGIRRFFLD